jgi:hypothetical protein
MSTYITTGVAGWFDDLVDPSGQLREGEKALREGFDAVKKQMKETGEAIAKKKAEAISKKTVEPRVRAAAEAAATKGATEATVRVLLYAAAIVGVGYIALKGKW